MRNFNPINEWKALIIIFLLLPLFTIKTFAQSMPVTGKVVDAKTNDPLVGATVGIKGGTNAVATNAQGQFKLQAKTGDVLEIRSIGYNTATLVADLNKEMLVKLVTANSDLSEVVVVGYGTQKKTTLAGAVAVVDNKAFQDRIITTPLQGLQGAAPGIVITNSSFQPGKEGFNVQVRGNTSINGSSALVVVDGVPLSDGSQINSINPNDIQNISILKDAAASIYGSRAAAGVLLVTTKRGRLGRPVVNYVSSYAFKQLGLTYSYSNPKQWYEMYNEAAINSGNTNHSFKAFEPYFLAGIDTVSRPGIYGGYDGTYLYYDYNELLFHTAESQIQNISISGANDRSDYYISLGYINDGSLLREGNNFNKKYNLKLNYNTQVTSKLKISSIVGLNYQNLVLPSSGDVTNPLGSVFNSFPGMAFSTRDGTKPYHWTNGIAPTWAAKLGGDDDSKFYKTDGQVKAVYNIINDLSFTALANASYQTQKRGIWHNPITNYDYEGVKALGVTNGGLFDYTQQWSTTFYRNAVAQFDYKKQIDDHTMTLLAGASYEKNTYNYLYSGTQGGNLTALNRSLNLGETSTGTGQIDDEWALGSFFGRATYNYKDKYILEGILRNDGSSKFVAEKRWRTFGSVLAAWRLSQEGFISRLGIFNELKLRASYGTMGNQNGIGSYDYIQLVNINNPSYAFGTSVSSPTDLAKTASYANTVSYSRTWETIKNKNIGIDFSILKSRLSGSFDLFTKENNNMLIGVTFPTVLGYNPPATNNGKLRTNGWEAQLTWADRTGDFSYSITGMLSDSKDKLLSLAGAKTYNQGSGNNIEDYPINSIFGYVSEGIIRNQQTLDNYKKLIGSGSNVPANIGIGDMMYRDVDGDGKITQYGDGTTHKGDLVYLGNGSLHYVYSARINLGWKNFDLSALFTGVWNNLVFRNGTYYPPGYPWGSQSLSYYYGKTFNAATNPDAEYPRLTLNQNGWNYTNSTFTLLNNRYVRLKNLVVGYSLPKSVIQKTKFLSAVRIYFSGENLWELAKIKDGWDPENGSLDGYPSYRTLMAGLNVTF